MDRIGDFIARIRNAGLAGQKTTIVPYTRLLSAIADVLKKEGYIGDVEKKDIKGIPHLVIELVYLDDGTPRVEGTRRMSKLSGRMYKGADEIKIVRQGFGKVIVSTPKGIVTGEEAQKEHVGGEILFEIW